MESQKHFKKFLLPYLNKYTITKQTKMQKNLPKMNVSRKNVFNKIYMSSF